MNTPASIFKRTPGIAPLMAFLLAFAAATNLKADITEARNLFNKNCASCHGKDGRAQTPAAKMLGVKDLSQSKLTKEQIILQIREGKQDSATSSKMPAFKEKLTDEQIESLVPVVVGFREASPADQK